MAVSHGGYGCQIAWLDFRRPARRRGIVGRPGRSIADALHQQRVARGAAAAAVPPGRRGCFENPEAAPVKR